MRYNKFKAFTLAEIMVLLLTLSILMAAFAPVFTRRYSNVTSDVVWTHIPGDDNYNAYFDAPNKLFLNQAFIGLTPVNRNEVSDFSGSGAFFKCSSGVNLNGLLFPGNLVIGDGICTEVAEGTAGATEKPAYAKLVIGASSKLGSISNDPPQNQMQFRMSTRATDAVGALTGSLFAGNSNMLVGGPYVDITNSAERNTAFGPAALKALTNGDGNTAVGNYALAKVSTGSANTAVGYNAGNNISSGSANTFIGTQSGAESSSGVSYNTAVGFRAAKSVKGSGNTAVGNYALNDGAAAGNTAVGTYALRNATGKYNTAVGHSALSNMVKGNYNTAIGANACSFIGEDREISKVTCIGANSGAKDQSDANGDAGLPTGTGDNYDVPDRVFLGSYPVDEDVTKNKQKPFAVLEVHNSVKDPVNTLEPFPGGEESVIVNGNLVVRGMTYLEAPIYRTIQGDDFDPKTAPKGLVLFKTFTKYQTSNASFEVFGGYDGTDRSGASYGHCRSCSVHQFDDIRPNCICTAVGPGYAGKTDYKGGSGTKYSSTSYDWYSKTINANGIYFKEPDGTKYSPNCSDAESQNYYTDQSTGQKVYLARTPGGASGASKSLSYGTRETDRPYAHLIGKMHSCCPKLDGKNVTSDIRLKNVGEKYTAGLDEIKKINVYHFTFKNDVNKLPQVGVIAQDLKTVFPNAVTQDEDGYYHIRWDEMLYAAINAVKTLNSKIESLASKIATDKDRIAALKKDNAEMYAELDKLVDELEELEAKKK